MLKLGFKFCADFCSGSFLFILLYLNSLMEGYEIILMHDILQYCMLCETYCILNESQQDLRIERVFVPSRNL